MWKIIWLLKKIEMKNMKSYLEISSIEETSYKDQGYSSYN